jgi:hypothetical protein
VKPVADTYNIGSITNDLTEYWKEELYTEYTGEQLRDDLDNNVVEIGDKKNDPSRKQIDKIKDKEDILVAKDTRKETRKSSEQLKLERKIREKQEDINQHKRELRKDREIRREEQNDLDSLQDQLEELQQELKNINEQLEDLGLTPPVISSQEINNLNQQEQQEANDLLSRRGSLNNTLGNLQQQVEQQQEQVDKATQQVNETRRKKNQAQEEKSELKDQLQDAEPDVTVHVTVSDIITVCETSYETYISGKYRDPSTNSVTREIEARGTKKIIMGSRAPENIRDTAQEQSFWDNVYEETKETVFRNPGGFPKGEWFDLLIDRMEELGTAGAQGQFTGANWEWTFKDSSGGHEFPDHGELQDSKNQRCETFNDMMYR